MNGSSDFRSNSTVDDRHYAAIESARRQFEKLAGRTVASSGTERPLGPPHAATAWLADTLPGYQIGAEIHRGGQGVVYRSVQRGTERDVAIKVMREGPFGGPRARARFEREIQILGRLKHPNIVTIHESGASADGHYFVMDYIPGDTLDAWVARARPNVRTLLAMFGRICDAVNVAHLHGVIHRDLKPANIRVDANGQPHVLDFGLAKVDEDDALAADSHARSMTGQFIGSLPWASPEQIEGKPGDIDVRTDVYALGVVLFQALTGVLPHRADGNMRELVDNICRVDPPSPRTLRPEIDGEVSAIVLKCLSKDKAHRYQGAGELARDIERYLAGKPIEAKRDSAWYVFTKQLRRHRLAATAIAILLITITAALATSLTFWRRAVRERDAARLAQIAATEARDEANNQASIAAAVTHFLTNDVLLKLDPYNAGGEDLSARELFDQAAKDVDAGAFADQPQVEFEIRSVLGLVNLWRSDFARAEVQFRSALKIARSEFGDDGEKTVRTMSRLGMALSRLGRIEEAEPLIRASYETLSRTRGEDDLSTIMSRSALAGWYLDAQRPDEAEKHYRAVLEARTRLQGTRHTDTLAVMASFASSLASQKKFDEAERVYAEALRLNTEVRGPDHPETLLCTMHLGNMLLLAGRLDEARPIGQRAYEQLLARMGPAHESTLSAMITLAQIYQGLGHWNDSDRLLREALAGFRAARSGGYQEVEILILLSVNLTRQGKLAEAETMLRDALDVQERVGGHEKDRLRILSNLVNVLGEQGKMEAAVAPAEECLALGRKVYGDESDTTIIFINNHAFALRGARRFEESEAQLRTALAMQQRLHPEGNALTYNLLHNLALAMGDRGLLEEQIPLLREALAGRRESGGDGDPMTLKTIHALATVLSLTGNKDEAEPLFREALSRAETTWPDGHFMTEHYRRGLGVFLVSLKRFAEAEPLLLLSHERDKTLLAPGHPNLVEGVEKLAELYEAWGKPEEAEKWRAEMGKRRNDDAPK